MKTSPSDFKTRLDALSREQGFSLFGVADITGIRDGFNLDPETAARFPRAVSLGKRLLDSLATLLKPTGILCIGDLEPEDGSFHCGTMEVHQGFDTAELKRLVEDRQLRVTHCHTMHTVHKEDSEGNRRAYPLFFLAAEKTTR